MPPERSPVKSDSEWYSPLWTGCATRNTRTFKQYKQHLIILLKYRVPWKGFAWKTKWHFRSDYFYLVKSFNRLNKLLNADLTKIRGLETGTRNILNKFGIFSLKLHGRKFELRTNDPCYKLRRTKLFEDFHKSLIFFLTFWLCNIRLVYIRMNICISLYRL